MKKPTPRIWLFKFHCIQLRPSSSLCFSSCKIKIIKQPFILQISLLFSKLPKPVLFIFPFIIYLNGTEFFLHSFETIFFFPKHKEVFDYDCWSVVVFCEEGPKKFHFYFHYGKLILHKISILHVL